MAANMIEHFDVAGANVEALGAFYNGLFGWEIAPRGPGYAQVATEGLRGALVEAPTPSVTIGVTVADLKESLARAERLGGAIVMPATDNGWVMKAQVRDPSGNVVTLIQK